jgi:tRNA modification GTPase
VLAADLDVGVPVRLLDAAGDRVATGADAEGVRRARETSGRADLVLFVVDATRWEAALPLEPRGVPTLLVVNKCDLAPGEGILGRFHVREAVCVSARTGAGTADLRRAIRRMLAGGESKAGARFRVDLRQWALLREAEAALERAASTAPGLGMEFVALDLRAALDALGAITGRDVTEDLLDRVFSRFCIGK